MKHKFTIYGKGAFVCKECGFKCASPERYTEAACVPNAAAYGRAIKRKTNDFNFQGK